MSNGLEMGAPQISGAPLLWSRTGRAVSCAPCLVCDIDFSEAGTSNFHTGGLQEAASVPRADLGDYGIVVRGAVSFAPYRRYRRPGRSWQLITVLR